MLHYTIFFNVIALYCTFTRKTGMEYLGLLKDTATSLLLRPTTTLKKIQNKNATGLKYFICLFLTCQLKFLNKGGFS